MNINVNLNGQPLAVAEGTTLSAVVPKGRGVAAALNGVVVPAASWESTSLSENDAVEVVTAHQGG